MGTGTLIVCSVGLLGGFWLLWRIPAPAGAGGGLVDVPAGGLVDVAVVIPARNEERSLPVLLASLCRQRPGEIVVVDDHSADGTAQVAAAAGATVIAAPELPPGWTGKAWACWTGAQATTAGTLVFLDADTRLHPGGLEKIVAELRRAGGLVSVQPFHTTSHHYERLAAFFNVVAMMGVEAFTPRRRRTTPTGAFGPCLTTTRSDYDAAGGHAGVRGEVVEDVALARRYATAGLPVTCFGGRGVVDFRMYPEGPAQLAEGFTKNFGRGAAGTRPVTLVLIFLWITGAILAVGGMGQLTPAAVAPYGGYVLQLGWMLRRIGRFGWWPALLYPVALVFFIAVFARSVVLTYVRREVTWRGRTIRT